MKERVFAAQARPWLFLGLTFVGNAFGELFALSTGTEVASAALSVMVVLLLIGALRSRALAWEPEVGGRK